MQYSVGLIDFLMLQALLGAPVYLCGAGVVVWVWRRRYRRGWMPSLVAGALAALLGVPLAAGFWSGWTAGDIMALQFINLPALIAMPVLVWSAISIARWRARRAART